ncbi:MAG: orotidine-5'-phosphate decarboxylase, partial [Nocardioidaceae bacterium]
MRFGTRLQQAVDGRGRLCVGIDPHPALLDAWGLTDSPLGLERFAMGAVEALGAMSAVLKPQSAFFE